MLRNIVGVVAGLAAFLAVAFVAGFIMRTMWPAYVSVVDAMTFTLPMMIARLSIGALAAIATGFVAACITQSPVARLIPGFILLVFFIPDHVMLWNKFPIWYHLWFLLSLVPLTYAGNYFGRGFRDEAHVDDHRRS
jgi:ABC-type dipeptide/oligopeptide/nickel transport system permease component